MKLPSITFSHVREDFLSGFSVFLITIPLCLGISLASGAPVLAGLLSGVIGGLIMGYLSGSEVSVSGPAAGLAVIVLQAIQSLGYESFLVTVVLAGILQIFLGLINAGRLSAFFPNSTVRGLLVAIGLVLILKQIPHALGWDVSYEGQSEFYQSADGQNTFTAIFAALTNLNVGAFIISITCLFFLFLWDNTSSKRKSFKLFPSALGDIFIGIGLNEAFLYLKPEWYLGNSAQHMVQFPTLEKWTDITAALTFPDFSALAKTDVYVTAITLALVASLESLICLEVADRIDTSHRYSSPNQELIAQGIGNTICGLLGGLPITAVVIRTTTNVYSGAKTRLSTLFHGVLLLISIFTVASFIRMIPLACLAALLIFVGYKLARISIFKNMYIQGMDQFVPFITTILAIIFTDLLSGVGIGLVVGIIYVIYSNFSSAITMVRDGKNVLVVFSKDVSFLNNANLKDVISSLKEGDSVLFDGAKAQFIDKDFYQTLEEFKENAHFRNIKVEFRYVVQRNFNTKKSNGIISTTPVSE